jgi:hypothetical protein
MIQRWASKHERAFLTLFVTFVLIGLAAAAVEAASDDHAPEVGAGWLAAFAVTAVAMLLRHRSGRLILRRAKDRERQGATNRAGRSLIPIFVAVVITLNAIGVPARDVIVAAMGGIFTAVGPVLLWIAFVLRPDQRPGEDL